MYAPTNVHERDQQCQQCTYFLENIFSIVSLRCSSLSFAEGFANPDEEELDEADAFVQVPRQTTLELNGVLMRFDQQR